jgi:ribosome-associated protein
LANNKNLVKYIIEGILEKKGKEVINIDLNKLEFAVCDNFIICHGDSSTQGSAIAESVEEKVKNNLNLRVWHREGLENARWVLLDYSDVVVHIFQKEAREYYKLEELWGDADITLINEE